SGAISAKAILSGDGFVEFGTLEKNRQKIVGLGNGDADQGFKDVEFGILLTNTGLVQVFESGTRRGSFGKFKESDRFRVSVQAGKVKYLRNGSVFYTSALTPSYPLVVDVALFNKWATVIDAFIAGDVLSKTPPTPLPGGPYYGWVNDPLTLQNDG